MLNKGVGNKGFTVCCDCGAAMPGDDESVLKNVMRPYRSKFNRTRCKHTDTINVNLGYDFITDMLVLEFELDRMKVDVNAEKSSWLNRAGQSLVEALRLAACRLPGIGYRIYGAGNRVSYPSKFQRWLRGHLSVRQSFQRRRLCSQYGISDPYTALKDQRAVGGMHLWKCLP